ncbi:MAG: class I SAM-dependent methyltransferase [Rhodospirillales bacterium]
MTDEQQKQVLGRVAAMYERHPYPPVDDDIEAYVRGEAWLLESPNPGFHLYWPYRTRSDDLDILIAGCGTQQAAQIAAGLPGARIVATDISDNSLGQTARLLERIGAKNVRLEKRSIEDTAGLAQDFDLVVCTGVLHHLSDPEAGLAALASVLRAGGSMHLMLYGRHGRQGIYMLQALFRAMRIDPLMVSKADIAALRTLVEHLPVSHPFAAVRHLHPDWQDDEGLVDLLLHVQDRAYAIDEVHDFLGGAGLKMQKLLFAGRTDPMFSPLAGVGGKAFKGLSEVQQRACVELYRASIKKHTFIACHRERPESDYETVPVRANWAHLRPILAHGLEVERPDSGRKAYRITWPYHGEADIAVETTENGIALLEACDGVRTIAEAVGKAGFRKSDTALMRQLEGFLERCARADFLSFSGRPTSSD